MILYLCFFPAAKVCICYDEVVEEQNGCVFS